MIGTKSLKLSELTLRGTTTVDILTNDHNAIKKLLDTLTQAEPADRRPTFERLKAALVVHNATEENLVYPALAVNAGEQTESANLFHETAEADTLIFTIDQMLTGAAGDFVGSAKKLQAAVLEHIEHEEGSAFIHLDRETSEGQAKSLTASVIAFRQALEFQP